MAVSAQNRTNKFLKNVIGSIVLQVVTIVTGFISPILMLRAFGSEINGITLSILQFISYISLVEAGLGNATVFALYKPLALKDNEARDAVISAARISYNRVGIIFLILGVILAAIYPLIGKTDVLSSWELSFLVLVLCLSGIINFFVLAKYRTVLTADQCGYWVSMASAAQLLVNLAIIYITIKLDCSVIVVRGSAICSFFVTTVILSIVVHRKYKGINYYALPNMKALDKRKDAMTIQLLGIVTTGAPIIILTAMSNFKELSVYAVYGMIVGSLTTCLTVFTSGLSASFGNIYASESDEKLRKIVSEFMTGFYFVLTIIYTIAVITIVPFVDVYTKGITDVNYHVPIFGFLIVIKGVIEHLYSPHGMFVQSFGKFKELRLCFLFQAIIAVVATILLTTKWGINGAMVAMIITHLYTVVYYLIITKKKIVRISMIHNLKLMVTVLSIFCLSYLISRLHSFMIETYPQWILYAFSVGVMIITVTTISFFAVDKANMRLLYQRILRKKKTRLEGQDI